MSEVALPLCPCPVCGHELSAVTSVGDPDQQPQPGDITVCAYCTSFLLFNEDMTMRSMTEDEVAELDDERRMALARIRRVLKQVMQDD